MELLNQWTFILTNTELLNIKFSYFQAPEKSEKRIFLKR